MEFKALNNKQIDMKTQSQFTTGMNIIQNFTPFQSPQLACRAIVLLNSKYAWKWSTVEVEEGMKLILINS